MSESISGSLVVSYDIRYDKNLDKQVLLLVGERGKGHFDTKILNAISGKRAEELLKELKND